MNDSTTTTSAQILLIEGDRSETGSLSVVLDRGAYNIVRPESLEYAMAILESSEVHVVVLTLEESQTNGAEIVRQIRYLSPFTEVIVGMPDEKSGEVARTDEAGAFDSLTGPLSPERMLSRIQKAVEYRRIRIERSLLKEQVAMRYSFDNIIGVSKEITDLKGTISRVAPTDIPILITGASGTGKELVARVIHHHSLRRNGRLVVVDCSALPENVLLGQLFETEKHAELPLLQRADGGTLILDNIGGMSTSVQDRLLAFLKDFTILDSDGRARRLDIRFVTLTSDQLDAKAESGAFAQDLLDQLSTVTIELPSLIDRADDIEILIDNFLHTIASENEEPAKTITRTAVDRLLHHSWPGNVRELENTIRRAFALCNGDQMETDDISFVGSGSDTRPRTTSEPVRRTTVSRLDDNQRSLIQRALVENDWNYTQTAQELGIGRTTLWRKVKKFNLKRDAETATSEAQ
ncbi:MAG: sigma-54 dependent transcriptional regulator [candidate division Zixibacteria bacterium]|nr:sigma-54 dependent transcriptional regulator [candidate division Zixibacteria bacterium]